MSDVFSHNIAYGGAFSADAAKLTFGGSGGSGSDSYSAGGASNYGGVGLLTQQLRYTYQQVISRVYELGGPNIYLVSGRTMGSLSLSRILGVTTLVTGFYTAYGNVCNAGSNNLTFSAIAGCSNNSLPGTTGSGSMAINLNYCVIEQVGGDVQAENMLMRENVNMIYLSMSIDSSTGT